MSEENDNIKMTIEREQSPDERVSTEILMESKAEHQVDSSEVLDDAWAKLTQDWQAQPTPKTDINALVKRTRRRTQGAKFCFVLNIIATLGLLLAFLYGVYDGRWGEAINIYIGFASLFSIIFVYFETKIRVATWSQLCDSPEKAIDNAIASSESSMKYLWITKISFLPFLPLVNWFVYSESQANEKTGLPAYLMVNGFMLIVFVTVSYLHNKRKKEYQQLSQTEKV